jgi:hypothetical protein
VYLHGIKFNIAIDTLIPATTAGNWQNGHIHFALVQLKDHSPSTASQKPTFSAPIGDSTNDSLMIVPYDSSTISLTDIQCAKLRNPEWNVITHRKYFVGKRSSTSNTAIQSSRTFYVPIKKNVEFRADSFTAGTKPFAVLFWYVPDNQVIVGSARTVKVYLRYSTFFRNVL